MGQNRYPEKTWLRGVEVPSAGTSHRDMEPDDSKEEPRGMTIDRVREDIGSKISSGKEAIENVDSDSLLSFLKRMFNAVRRDLSNASGTSLLTRAPAITVALCLLAVSYTHLTLPTILLV